MAAIRTSTEIEQIITRGQHTMADLGLEIVNERKQGTDPEDVDHRAKMYRLILLLAYFRNILNSDGELKEYYNDPDNEVRLNKVLNGIVRLSRIFDGPAIPKLTTNNLPIVLFSTGEGGDSGGVPSSGAGITRISNPDIDGSEVIDTFSTTESEGFAMWILNVMGSNLGEGSCTVTLTAGWRTSPSGIDMTEIRTPDIQGITSPITFLAELSSPTTVALRAIASTNNWSVQGVRIK